LLSDTEKLEIFKFPDIYFVGTAGLVKIGKGRLSGLERSELNIVRAIDKEPCELFNNGFDDSRGDYYLTKRDHIGYRYEILSLLGKGSFGQVVKCFDHKKQINVAVKLIRNKKRFEKQGLVEVKILKYLKEQVGVIVSF
jgi:serine/threonine protein kinase